MTRYRYSMSLSAAITAPPSNPYRRTVFLTRELCPAVARLSSQPDDRRTNSRVRLSLPLFGRASQSLTRRSLVELPKLALATAGHAQELLARRDRLFLRIRLKDGEPANDLLRFSKRTVGHRRFSVIEANSGSLRAWQTTFSCQQHTGLHGLFDQPSHGFHLVLRGRLVSLHSLVDRKESHTDAPVSCVFGQTAEPCSRSKLAWPLLPRRTKGGRIDTRRAAQALLRAQRHRRIDTRRS